MITSLVKGAVRTIRGVADGVRARPLVFVSVAILVFILHILLPPLVLSIVRKPVDFFTVNPWLKRLPEFLVSTEVPLERKLEFLPKLALFWFSSDGPYGSPEWGFAVDTTDLGRFILTSLLLGAYFALWVYRRDRVAGASCGAIAGRPGGVLGAGVSALGLSTGPCSVVGCGAPVLPVVGLAFVGLSSSTLKFLADLSRVTTPVILLMIALGVAYLGWQVGDPKEDR